MKWAAVHWGQLIPEPFVLVALLVISAVMASVIFGILGAAVITVNAGGIETALFTVSWSAIFVTVISMGLVIGYIWFMSHLDL